MKRRVDTKRTRPEPDSREVGKVGVGRREGRKIRLHRPKPGEAYRKRDMVLRCEPTPMALKNSR